MVRYRKDHDGSPCNNSTGSPSGGPASTHAMRKALPPGASTSP